MVVFQAEDGIRDLVRSRGLGDVYKRQALEVGQVEPNELLEILKQLLVVNHPRNLMLSAQFSSCLLYTSDAADERSSVDLGGRRIINKKNTPGLRCAR